MKKTFLIFALFSFITTTFVFGGDGKNSFLVSVETQRDSSRITELNRYWQELAQTVRDGNFDGYAATYHEDAIVVFATGKNKTSVPLSKALAGWKEGFQKTKEGKQKDDVEFRFSQRIGDKTTAHETGIFRFTSRETNGKLIAEYILHFEMLLIKRGNRWYGIMEHQKNVATEEEWEALK